MFSGLESINLYGEPMFIAWVKESTVKSQKMTVILQRGQLYFLKYVLFKLINCFANKVLRLVFAAL